MSQVVVTEDSYRKAREKSLQQEKRILKDAEFEHWHLSDVTKMYGILRAIAAPLALPILLFWSLLLAGFALAVGIVSRLLQVLGKLFGGTIES